MRIIPINEAEAIISPLWDPVLAEKDAYNCRASAGVSFEIGFGLASLKITIENAKMNQKALVMSRDCSVNLMEYDVLRLFASLPEWCAVKIDVVIDGTQMVILPKGMGRNCSFEYDAPVQGQWLTSISFEFTLYESRPVVVEMCWLGLANAEKQKIMEKRVSPYSADWLNLLLEPETLEPEIGMLFGGEDVQSLQQKVQSNGLKQAYSQLKHRVDQFLDYVPESEIGKLLARNDGQFCRTRDNRKRCTALIMADIAFVGLIEQDVRYARLAARMALSAAHHQHWFESDMGVFPGSTWHHRSFTEEVYCRGCALVLDWAGKCLSNAGKKIIRDAIIMKGLPRIEADFKTMEYIRHMNQGITFSSGRIFGLLSLIPVFPRYASLLDEAERDLLEMIDNYVLKDGGTLEGMGYWHYTFDTALPVLYALARSHNIPFETYVSESVKRTGCYPLAMLSLAEGGTGFLPINDCHSGRHISLGVAASYVRINQQEDWKSIYAAGIESGNMECDLFGIIMAPDKPQKAKSILKERKMILPNTGQISSIRYCHGLDDYIHFHLCSGPAYHGHCHEDKGSFIIETTEESLAMDRGITVYSHPETTLMKWASRHNLLCPVNKDGSFMHQKTDGFARLGTGISEARIMAWASDNKCAWQIGVFNRNIRRVISPYPDLYIIDDDIQTDEPMSMSFRLNTLLPISRNQHEFWINGLKASLCVIPLNWCPMGVSTDCDGIDDHEQSVNVLGMTTAKETCHRLITAIQINRGIKKWTTECLEDRVYCTFEKRYVECAVQKRPALTVTVKEDDNRILMAKCFGHNWHKA